MRRRTLSNLGTVLSVVLFGAVCVLWVRSNRPVQHYVVWRGETTIMAQSKGNRLWLQRWRVADPLPTRPASSDLKWVLRGTTNPPYRPTTPIEVGYTPPPPSLSNGFGFGWLESDLGASRDGRRHGSRQMLAVPHWSLAAAFAIPPAVWALRRALGRRRLRARLCTACGYDLRATPDRCPEGRTKGISTYNGGDDDDDDDDDGYVLIPFS
jgi:hypothetical protein